MPDEVVGILAQKTGGGVFEFYWDSLAYKAGFGTTYDVFSGSISNLRADGGLQSGSCLSDDFAATLLPDPTVTPPPGDGYYFVIRGQNLCPGDTGTYGEVNWDTTADLSGANCN